MATQDQKDEGLLWETLGQAWENLPNEISGDKVARVKEVEGSEKGKKRVKGLALKRKEKVKEETTSDHDIHIWTERERRKKMRNMFSSLHSLLPKLPPKADKSTIVDEAVKYIKDLEITLQRLQKQKLERLQGGENPNSLSSSHPHPLVGMLSTREAFMADQLNDNDNDNEDSGNKKLIPVMIQTWTSSNVVLNVCGDEAQFLVYAPKKIGLLASICAVLQNLQLELISAHISSHSNRRVYMIQTRLAKGASNELLEVITKEDRFKQAGAEIMMWVSS